MSQSRQLFEALKALAGMYNQYCPPPTAKCPYPGHMFMSAGEDAEDVLDAWGLIRPDESAIDPETDWDEVPERVKALRHAAPAE